MSLTAKGNTKPGDGTTAKPATPPETVSTESTDVVVEGTTPGFVECYVLQRFKEHAGDPYEPGEIVEFTPARAEQLRAQGLIGDEPIADAEESKPRRRRAK